MTRLIDLYKEWMEKGRLPNGGLCVSLNCEYEDSLKEYFYPTPTEFKSLSHEGYEPTYWASGLPSDHKDEYCGFTPLRQTIVLLICAIHNEL